MEHGSRQHARYSASGAHRWKNCHGSMALTASAPPRLAGPYAEDGTEAHELVEYALREGYRLAHEAYLMNGKTWQHRADTLSERVEAVQMALDYVWDILDSFEDAVLILEHAFDFPSPHTKDAGGHNDIIIYVPSLGLLYVIDYKHGAGEPVEVVKNEQLSMYGVGGMNWAFDQQYEVNTINLIVIQPRCFHPKGVIREWMTTVSELQTYVDETNVDIAACEDIIHGRSQPAYNPGQKQCRWCPATVICPAIEARALAVISDTFRSVKDVTLATLPDVRSLSLDRIGYILAMQGMVEDWFADVYKYGLELTVSGTPPPGRKLVQAQARSTWYGDEYDIAKQLSTLSGATLEQVMPRKLITITAAKDLVGSAFKARAGRGNAKKAQEEANNAIAILTDKKSSGNYKLVGIEDKGEAVSPAQINFASVKPIGT